MRVLVLYDYPPSPGGVARKPQEIVARKLDVE